MNYDEITIYGLLVFKHMLQPFIFMGYSTRTSNYLEQIALCDLTHMMNTADLVAVNVET